MSKKKSSPKVKKSATLDSELIEKPVEKVTAPVDKVSLKEYSKTAPLAFSKVNYKMLLIGLGINILGYILMIGGAATELNEFNEGELFSHMRITVSPILITAGFVVIAYAIMRKPKDADATNEA